MNLSPSFSADFQVFEMPVATATAGTVLSCLLSVCVLWLTVRSWRHTEKTGVWHTYCPGSTRSMLEPNIFTSCSS